MDINANVMEIIRLSYLETKNKILDVPEEMKHLKEILTDLTMKKDFVTYWHYLRDRYFLSRYGVNITSFITNLLLSGLPPESETFMEERDRNELEYLHKCFGMIVHRVEAYIRNPYSIVSIEHNFAGDKTRYNFIRADGNMFESSDTVTERANFIAALINFLLSDIKRTNQKVPIDTVKKIEMILNEIKEGHTDDVGK